MRTTTWCFVVAGALTVDLFVGTAHAVDAADRGTVTQANVAFVTSVIGTGNLASWPDSGSTSGLTGADNICKARAAAAGLADATLYIAWMSDATDDAYCRAHGMSGTKASNCGGLPEPPSFAGPWQRTDGHPFGEDVHLTLETIQVLFPARG